MKNSQIISRFNYLYVALILLWSPLQGTVITFDGKGRIRLALTLMAFIINSNRATFKKILFSKPVALWFIWCLFVTVNTYIQGYMNPSLPFLYFTVNNVFCPCMIMAVCAYEYLKSPKKFLNIVLLVFLVYAFIGTFVMDIGYVALEEGKMNANTLGNLLALNVMLIIFFIGVRYCRKEMSLTSAIALIVFAIGIVVVSATRKALGASVIMIISIILSQIKFTFGNMLKIILPTILLYYGLIFMMGNTTMGERMGELEEQTDIVETRYNIGDNAFLKAMGDRAPHYILGYEVFKDNPVAGIGLSNFMRKTGYPSVLHTEYMVQLCECGIIGSILFVMFYWSIIKMLLKKIRLGKFERPTAIVMLGTVAALLFIYLTAWSYSFPFYFAVLGTIVGFIHSKETRLKEKEI